MSMMACPHCGFPNTVERTTCKSCRQDLRTETAPVSETPLPPPELARLLEAEIVRQQAAGWRLQTRTETTAQLVREVSNTNGCLLILLFCLAIIPGILYAVFAKRTSSLYLSIDAYGRINRLIDGLGQLPVAPAVLPTSGEAPAVPDVAGRLKQLDALKDQGVITEDEYQQRRQRILDEV
jgi:hypothetical protein